MKPRLITPMTLAAGAAERWHAQYGKVLRADDKSAIGKALFDLGPSPTPGQVNAVIGNDSWTAMPACDGCGAEGEEQILMVGEEPDYESNTAHLCFSCACEAFRLFGERSLTTRRGG